MMTVIGLTGGTGSGKTTLLHELQTHGAAILDCDRIYDRLLSENGELQAELRGGFPDVFREDGTLDRTALADCVFGDPAALRRLNAIVYYYMGLEVRRLLTEQKRRGAKLAVIDAVNLVDSGLGELCDTTAAVLADEKARLLRIMKRDGIDEAAARRRITAQQTEEYYRKRCKIVLENNGTREAFLDAAKKALKDYL